jgi:hypothetical protein
VLINALRQLNSDVVEIEELRIGGENDDWPVEQHPDSPFSLELGSPADDGDGDQDFDAEQDDGPDDDEPDQDEPDDDAHGFGGDSPKGGRGEPRPDPRRGPGFSSFDGRVP